LQYVIDKLMDDIPNPNILDGLKVVGIIERIYQKREKINSLH